MFKFLTKLVTGSLLYGIALFAIANYIPKLGFIIHNDGQYGTLIILLIIGLVFFLVNRILKKIIIVFKLPLNILTLGFGSVIINIAMLFVFVLSVNHITPQTGLSIQLGSILQIIILSIVLAMLDYLVQTIQ